MTVAPLDIAMLLGFPEISGGTNVILEHALGLTQRGHTVSIVTELPFDPVRLDWKAQAGSLPCLSHEDLRRSGRVFDLAIATWWRSVFDLPHVPARRYAYFCQSIESRFFHARDGDIKALADYTYRQPLPIVTEASWIAAHLRTYYGRTATLVLNGIDKQVFRPAGPALAQRPAEGLRVLVEGPLGVPFKRVEYTLDLCRRAGVDDLWLLTSSDCARWPGVSRVCSRVPMQAVGDVLRSCDVLVKLSTVEGMFGPPLEMMHCGGTAITTDVTGHEEYMRHGENGLVVRRGAEAEVIQHLRALQHDRRELERLKAGALRTAAAWPAWPDAVAGMERFVHEVCAAPLREADLQQAMLEQLGAALRLAGPLHTALRPEFSGRQLLRMAAGKARRKVARLLGRWVRTAQPSAESQAPLVTPPLTPPVRVAGTRLRPQSHYRLCFIGDARRYLSHAPSRAPRATAVLLDVRGVADPDAAARAMSFGPDFTIIFEPEQYDHAWLATLPGRCVGYSPQPVTRERLRAWRERFPLGHEGGPAFLHPDTDAVPELLAQGVAVAGPFLLPFDVAGLERPVTDADWLSREIELLLVGPAQPSDAPWLAAAREFPGFLHVAGIAGDAALRAVLARTRMALYLSTHPGDFVAAADAARAALCGALLLARGLPEAYGFMPGEHYHYFEAPEELSSLVHQQRLLPDARHVMRGRAQAAARAHDASEEWVRILERCFCLVPGAVEWDGRQPQPAATEAALGA